MPRFLLKLVLDIMQIPEIKEMVLMNIDCYSRMLGAQVILDKSGFSIKNAIMEWINDGFCLEEIITDNGRELMNGTVRCFLKEIEIKHTSIGVDAHQSNGRIDLQKIVDCYNKTYHRSIDCSPIEAFKKFSEKVKILNSDENKYRKGKQKRKIEKFYEGQYVGIAKNDNLKTKTKMEKGRFLKEG